MGQFRTGVLVGHGLLHINWTNGEVKTNSRIIASITGVTDLVEN